MATTHTTDSDSVEPSGSVFTDDLVVTSFLRHEVRLILAGYDLLGFLDGSLSAPTRFVQASDGTLVANPSASVFNQQDNLLTSWLLSTISSSFLSFFTDVGTASNVWLMANNLFVADPSTKQSHLRHEFHSLKKGSLSIRSYVDKIKGLCALFAAFGSQISEAERSTVLLAGLLLKFKVVVSSDSLTSAPLPFQRLVNALLECEARQM
ncbi:hypothetical protein PVK06_012783 [Gossypium arboreum]|uniref:Retrotransposon gag domain-containing protein n=1 Tax=Gossypium arboreum TaxID=29729 RepID=A0ABR0QDG2_GOSAR|nr:hypothetical protein PVK06_012783 [Gossypium arboreum]